MTASYTCTLRGALEGSQLPVSLSVYCLYSQPWFPRLEGLWCGAGRVEARTGSWLGKRTTSVIALELAPVKYFLPLILTSLVASPNEAQGITKQSAFV